MTILNQQSHIFVPVENIHPLNTFSLKNSNIRSGTLYFSDRVKFAREVSLESEVTKLGTYFVDYKQGLVTAFTAPIPNTTARYEYIKSPMTCIASPIIIHNIQNQDFKVKMFEQVLTDEGDYINGLPSALGSDLINELLSIFPVTWGE